MLYPLNSTPQVQPVKVHKKKNNVKKVNRRQRLWTQQNWKVKKKLNTCINLLWKVFMNSNNNYVINLQRIISVQ